MTQAPPSLPFADLLGVDIVEAGPTRVLGRLTVREDLCTAGGILHGGVYMSLADTVGAVGAFLNLPEGARTTTIESKTNFLGAVAVGGVITDDATPVHVGRRSTVSHTRIVDASGRLAALVTQTQMTILP